MWNQTLLLVCGLALISCRTPKDDADAGTDPPSGLIDMILPGDLPAPSDMPSPADLGSAGDLGAMGVPALAFCDPAGWCWENPLPHGAPIHSVWGPSSNDIWAVAGGGIIEHWSGTGWSLTKSATHALLADVWASSASDAWAVGNEGTIVHWNGVVWSTVPSSTTQDLSAVWGSGASDVWAVALTSQSLVPGYYHHTFVHWDGTSWKSVLAAPVDFLPSTITDMWGCSANEVYAVGTKGTAIRFKWNGKDWSVDMAGGSSSTYTGVWCGGGGPVMAANSCPSGMCEASIYPTPGWHKSWYALGALAASSSGDIWTSARPLNVGLPALTLHFNGVAWEELSADLLAPGFTDKPGSHFRWQGADILHRTSLMAPWVSSKTGSFANLRAVWGSAADKLWTVGAGGTILTRGSGGDWQAVKSPTSKNLNAIWGSSPGQIWAVGESGTLLASNGVSWLALSVGVTDTLNAVSGTGPNDVWVAGESEVLHFDGLGWSVYTTAVGGTALYAVSASDAWLVGGTSVWRFDGTRWNKLPLKTASSDTLYGVWASGPSDVWIVGSTALYHFDGTNFSTTIPSGITAMTGTIWGSGPSDVWVRAMRRNGNYSYEAENLRWDGTAWKEQPSETSYPYNASGLFGLKGVGVWAVGDGGSIIRYKP